MKHLVLPTIIWLILLSNVALAHTPVFLGDKDRTGVHIGPVITEPDYSWAYYGRLGPGSAAEPEKAATKGAPPVVEILPVQAKAGQELRLHLAIPQRPELRGFQPRVAVIGPGLPTPRVDDLLRELPVKPGEGEGVLLVPQGEPEASFEPFTQVRYWDYPKLVSRFPQTGPYKIVIYDPTGRGGRYTLAIGAKERLGIKDILGFPLTLARIRIWLWK